MGICQVVVWERSFIEPDLFDNKVPLDNSTPIYLINLLLKLGLGLRLDLQLFYFRIFTFKVPNLSQILHKVTSC